MKTRNEIYSEWCDGVLSILEDYDIYSREQIMKSRNADCIEYRAVLVSALMSKGLSDMRIQNVLDMSLQQIYRAKKLSLELSKDKNSIYYIILPIIKQYTNTIL